MSIRRGNTIDRRSLIRSGAVASLLAASGFTAKAAPRPGGTLRMAVPGPGQVSWTSADPIAEVVGSGVFERLTALSPSGELRGMLSSGWTASDHGRLWTFVMRADARFHDGSEVKPKDVIHSLDVAGFRPRRMVSAGDRSVAIHLDEPDAHLPIHLADMRYSIRPAGHAGSIIGTGPYRIVDFAEGDGARLQRIGKPGWFEAIEVLRIGDADRRVELLRSGRVDVADDIPDNAMAELEQDRHCAATPMNDSLVVWAEATGLHSVELESALRGQNGLVPVNRIPVHVSCEDAVIERAGATNLLKRLSRMAERSGHIFQADGAPTSIHLGLSTPDHVPATARLRFPVARLVGTRNRIAMRSPVDFAHIPESWFFT